MNNKIITMDSLVSFFKANKTFSFSARETGHPIVVSTFGKMNYTDSEDDGLMTTYLYACHTGLNRNGSYIFDEDMERALSSFANKPILAEIIEDSNGELDFGTHAMEFVEDKSGELKVKYIEKPVGIIPESNEIHLEYDKKEDKSFVKTKGYIFKDYGNETVEILERRKGVDVSVELNINELSWDAKNHWLVIKDFTFNGVTLLGSSVMPGMESARLELEDFSHYSSLDYTKEINEMKSRLEFLESQFSNKKSKEGGNLVNKLNQLLAKYGKTLEDINFEYGNLSDDELEVRFKEIFEDGEDTSSEEGGGTTSDSASTSESSSESDSSSESSDDGNSLTVPSGSISDDDNNIAGTTTKKKQNDFALSLQEKISALSELVCATYEESDNEWYGVTCFENPDYIVMHGYFNGRHYKQNYKFENDEYILIGDRVQVYEQFLTQEEIDELAEMKSNYSELKDFRANAEKKELESQRSEILNDERFSIIADTEEYKTLCNEVENYSLEDLETKLKLIVADYALRNGNFSQFDKQKGGRMFRIPTKSENNVTSKYGGIFSEN